MNNEGLLNFLNKTKKGRGLKETAKALIYGRDDYPPNVRKFMADNKYKKIVNIKVGKIPIEALTKEKGDLLTFGKYSQVLKNHNLDNLYHDWLELELDDGKKYKLEKNEVVTVKPYSDEIVKNAQYMDVPFNNNIRVNKFLKVPLIKKGKDFLRYDVTGSNCQDFVKIILNESKIDDKKIDDFVKQPTEGIFREKEFKVPIAISNAITNVAEKLNIIKDGAGKRNNIRNDIRNDIRNNKKK